MDNITEGVIAKLTDWRYATCPACGSIAWVVSDYSVEFAVVAFDKLTSFGSPYFSHYAEPVRPTITIVCLDCQHKLELKAASFTVNLTSTLSSLQVHEAEVLFLQSFHDYRAANNTNT